MHRDTQIARAADKLVDKPYALGDLSKGFDCLNFLKSFYSDMGFECPTEFDGVTMENYAELWQTDQTKTKKIMKRLLFSVGTEIEPPNMQRGDLLVFEGKKFQSFPGIYLGNGNTIVAFDVGVHVLPLRYLRQYLIGVRRLV